MAPDPGAAERAERGRTWRRRAADALGAIGGDRIRVRGDVAHGDRLTVDGWAVRRAAACLASLGGPEEEFVETAGTARRRLALAVLRAMRDDDGLAPGDAARRVLDDPDALPWGLRDWLDGLGEGGRAAAVGAAVGRAVAIVEWLHPVPLHRVRVAAPSDRLTWRVPGTSVFLTGRIDAWHGPSTWAPERALLAVLGGALDPDLVELEVGHVALAFTLNAGAVPARVSWVHLPTGAHGRTEADDDRLAAALDRAGAAVAARVAARFGPEAATTPGPYCRWCRRRADCGPGSAWVAAAPTRVGGLPPLG